MRCPDCNKFRTPVPIDPECNELTIDAADPATPLVLTITAEARIVLACEECGTELCEATQTAETTITVEEHIKRDDNEEECEWLVEEDACESTEETRKRRPCYGAEVSYVVTCGCGWHPQENGGTVQTDTVDVRDMDALS